MKGKRAKASVSSFEFNEPKEARAPIKLVQKRDFLLPRRKESKPDGTGMVHEEQPFNPSKETKWTKRPRQARRHKQEPCCGCLERGGFLLLLLPCQMQDLRFFFSFHPWNRFAWIHSHCPTTMTRRKRNR